MLRSWQGAVICSRNEPGPSRRSTGLCFSTLYKTACLELPPFFITTIMFVFLLPFICCLFSLVFALPVTRDVWVPQILSPDASTVWQVGGTYLVTWDVSSQPSQVTNPQGMVYLRTNDATQSNPIVQGFPLSAGQVNVTVPADTQPSNEWIVVRKSIFPLDSIERVAHISLQSLATLAIGARASPSHHDRYECM